MVIWGRIRQFDRVLQDYQTIRTPPHTHSIARPPNSNLAPPSPKRYCCINGVNVEASLIIHLNSPFRAKMQTTLGLSYGIHA